MPDHITKVRVYTSAGMKSDGAGVFTPLDVFGETSAEVCGVYGVNGSGTTKSFFTAFGETKQVQVITQTGTESPYVTVFKLIG